LAFGLGPSLFYLPSFFSLWPKSRSYAEKIVNKLHLYQTLQAFGRVGDMFWHAGIRILKRSAPLFILRQDYAGRTN